jgi:nitrite reductase/ring-hydroxylating ferredoxin subunit
VENTSKKPLWTEEFSVQATEDKYVLRRQFTKFLVLTSFGMFVGNVWIWAKSLLARPRGAFPEQTVALASEIPLGSVKTFNYPGPNDNCILVHTAADRFVAYSQKCTHLSCAVYYSRSTNRLECPCHQGYFSIEDGRVLQGPPPRPLPIVELARRGNQLVAVRLISSSEESGIQ